MTEIECTIKGKVQGVCYRVFVQDSANELGVGGYVKNQSDGSVLVLAQGEPDTLKYFIEYLNEGSLMAEVTGVAVEWRSADAGYDDFSIRY